jgi:lysophospholipase L1-like esterase
MRVARSAVLMICVAVLLAGTILAEGAFHLRDGDRVVFYGDSITDQRLYTTFVETFVLTRFPQWKVDFVHSGWGGDRVTGGGGGPIDLRLRRDVLAYRPAVMTIMLGMNDGSYRAWDEKIFETYRKGYQHILDVMKNSMPGIRITLIQPSPFDDVTRPPEFEGGYNVVLQRYGEFVRQLARQENMGAADMNAPVVAALQRAKALEPEGAKDLIPDRVHPEAGGHLLMAAALLKAWNAPAVVSSVEIDAAGLRVLKSENTEVTGLKKNGSLSWNQTDRSLPMSLDPDDATLRLALRASDFTEALNQQILKIQGLAEGRYQLAIDGESTVAFTHKNLANGVNLSVLPTPMAKQAVAVHELTIKHNNLHYDRWREVQVPFENDPLPGVQPTLDALDRLESEVIARQRALAQPKPRRFELIPVE